jgi:hypothetical protein
MGDGQNSVEREGSGDISGLDPFPTPQVFYTCSYNHAHRLRLEKLLLFYIELSKSSSGYFKPLLDPGGRFFFRNRRTAVSEAKRPYVNL